MLKNITYISASSPKRKRVVRNTYHHAKKEGSSRLDANTTKLLIIFIIGIVAGTFFVNLFCSGEYDKFGIYSEYFIEKFQNFDVEKKELFLYSFWNRTREILLILLLSCTSLGSIAVGAFLAYKGLTIGILISVYVIQYGIGGILLYSMSVFPHYITYVLMIIILVEFSKEIYSETRTNIRDAGRRILKTKFVSYIKCLLIILVLNVLTSYLETFVNLSIMKNILE